MKVKTEFQRFCKRCDIIFETKYRNGKFCENCSKQKSGRQAIMKDRRLIVYDEADGYEKAAKEYMKKIVKHSRK